jgi:hypothetical protein
MDRHHIQYYLTKSAFKNSDHFLFDEYQELGKN